jgi:hypothetical protein
MLCEDLSVATNPLEADVVHRVSARVFGLARRDVDGPSMVRCFLDNEQRIFRMASRAEGPYVVSVSGNGLPGPRSRRRYGMKRSCGLSWALPSARSSWPACMSAS